MTTRTKYKILSYFAFFLIFLIIWTALYFSFKNLDTPYIGMISAAISAVLAPRLSEHKTQTGSKIQLKWVFMKKIILL